MNRSIRTGLFSLLSLTTLFIPLPSIADTLNDSTKTTNQVISIEVPTWHITSHSSDHLTPHWLDKFVINAGRKNNMIAVAMTRKAMSFIGTRYVWGGTTPNGFDCSGFVQYAFRKVGIKIPRTADVQYAKAAKIHGPMKRGDLVFFQTYAPGASHVGIYLDHGKFVQAAGHGVRVAKLSDPYWKHRYIGVRRIAALR